MGVAAQIDRFQERYPATSIPLATIYKFFDDQGNYLAATLTYYAFVSIFPLMLLGTSLLGFVLEGRPELQQAILDSALSRFPIIGDQLGRPEGLQGSATGVIAGVLVALYGALGLGQALQNTQHVVWSVPRNSRPNPLKSRLKSLALIVTAGLSLLAVTAVSIVGSWFLTNFDEGRFSSVGQWLIPLLTVVVVGAMLTLLFQVAGTGSARESFWAAAPGGFTLALLWQILQTAGAKYVTQVLVGASSMTRTFALVLGLIALIFLGAIMAVLSMEVNVVLRRRLYPRALLTPFTDNVTLTPADREAYRAYAMAQRHKGFERVSVDFDETSDRDSSEPAEQQKEPDPRA